MTNLHPGFTLYGWKVVMADLPKRQLSRHVEVTDEFRADFNKFLLDFFGYANTLGDETSIVKAEHLKTIFCSHKVYNTIREELSREVNRATAEAFWFGNH